MNQSELEGKTLPFWLGNSQQNLLRPSSQNVHIICFITYLFLSVDYHCLFVVCCRLYVVLTEYIFNAGHQKPEEVPSETETGKEETGTDFRKLA